MDKRRPVIPGQDPFVHILDEKNHLYLLVQSCDDFAIIARQYRGTKKGRTHELWRPPRSFAYRQHVWAPELHKLDDEYYVYACGDKGDNKSHRGFVLAGNSPTGKFEFVSMLGDPDHNYNAIDHTVFRLNGEMYCVWSGWDGPKDGFPQNLYIAPMSDPCTISGERRLLSRPDKGWETTVAHLQEGPQFYQAPDGKAFLLYSCDASWTHAYKMGVLEYIGGPVLEQSSWRKVQQPLITGGGHGMVVTVKGKAWLVYHIKTTQDYGWADRVIVWAPLEYDDHGSLIVRDQHHEPWI